MLGIKCISIRTTGMQNIRGWHWHLYGSCSSAIKQQMIVQSVSSESVYKVSRRWMDVLTSYVLLFGAVYLDWRCFWQLITSSSMQKSVSSFVRSPKIKKPSCTGLLLETKNGFMVTTTRQSNRSSNGKVQTHWARKRRQLKSKVKSTLVIFYIKSMVHEAIFLAGQTVNYAVPRLRGKLWRQKNWISHRDNAPPNISFFNRDSLPKTT
jgi:hypothetical protein